MVLRTHEWYEAIINVCKAKTKKCILNIAKELAIILIHRR